MATPLDTQMDRTTLLCLFHHPDQAQAALHDLRSAGVPAEAISVTTGDSGTTSLVTALDDLEIPARDQKHLLHGLKDGGTILTVFATGEDHARAVEEIFSRNKAEKIDEAGASRPSQPIVPLAEPAGAVAAGAAAIPILEEQLEVGKRTVDRGGLRLYRRVVDIPVDESVSLREEHIHVDRHSIDRPVTDADQPFTPRSIELTETAEEAVIRKDARVVEEVVVSKDATLRTEHIHDTVRHTEIETEEIAPRQTSVQTPDPRRQA